jgi:hypothetical protein
MQPPHLALKALPTSTVRMFMKADGVFTKADTAERYDGRGV